MTSQLVCTWCDATVPDTDGFRLVETPSGHRAVFCRLEHLIPWEIKGSMWDDPAQEHSDPEGDAEDRPGRCAHCNAEVGEKRVVLTRRRGPHSVADRFCSVRHAAAWASAGGRWQ